ncbi:MAG: hypothetical protein Q8R24_05935 [Legionellaceae bacterium]|nr:hypothetical protein [Legionellaceae bacterium]
MQSLNKSKSHIKAETAHMRDVSKGATLKFINKSHKLANEMCEDGFKKINKVEAEMTYYSNELIDVIREKPVQSVMIAGGIGAFIAWLWK